ncbi:MAG: hypothetical protein AAB770_01800 [Patescibacteria group bacterium]
MEIPKNLDPRTQAILQSHLKDPALINGETGHLEVPDQTTTDKAPIEQKTKKAFPTFAEKSLPPERD